MKFLILALAVACANARPQSPEANAQIIRSDFNISPDGSFQYSIETSNDIQAQAQGYIKEAGNQNPALAINGQSHHTAPDGSSVDLTYLADENGFQPSGSHLPVPPPTPDYILKALDFIEQHPPRVLDARL